MAYLEATLLPACDNETLELDEMWSFVSSKKNRIWIWIALCRRTRQVVAWHYGPRDQLSCQMVWDKIPTSYQGGLCYTDFYASYKSVLPEEQHQPSAKKDGQTNHIERFNLTLRQSVARKTLSFSKKLLPHIQALRLFFVAYNRRAANKYLKSISLP